jgi:glycosyltransferase involved in cell wall biosynthesis
MNKIKSLLNKLVLLPEYVRVTLTHVFKRLPPNEREIVFTLDDTRLYRDNDGSGRLAYLTLRYFAEGGYNVYLHKNINFLTYSWLGKYGRPLYSLKNVKVTGRLPGPTQKMIYAFDAFKKEILEKPWKQLVFVNILKQPSMILGEKISLPYGMHPLMYQCRQTDKLESLRKNERRLKIFFGGNTVSSHYSNPRLKEWYGQMTRKEGLETLEGIGSRVKAVKDLDELFAVIKGKEFLNECRILKTDNKIEVATEDWLDILSRCEFFVCFSGTDLPMCHHTVEAMSVGVIPIIAYNDWFTPALEHGKTAIVYSGKEDLVRKIHEVFAMGPEEISRMRQNVIRYYEETFVPRNFVKRFEAQAKKLSTLLLYPKYKPADWEIREAKPLNDSLKSYFGDF